MHLLSRSAYHFSSGRLCDDLTETRIKLDFLCQLTILNPPASLTPSDKPDPSLDVLRNNVFHG
jgi:hypothetical protein